MAKKTGLKQVKDALDELLKAAHSAAADARRSLPWPRR